MQYKSSTLFLYHLFNYWISVFGIHVIKKNKNEDLIQIPLLNVFTTGYWQVSILLATMIQCEYHVFFHSFYLIHSIYMKSFKECITIFCQFSIPTHKCLSFLKKKLKVSIHKNIWFIRKLPILLHKKYENLKFVHNFYQYFSFIDKKINEWLEKSILPVKKQIAQHKGAI